MSELPGPGRAGTTAAPFSGAVSLAVSESAFAIRVPRRKDGLLRAGVVLLVLAVVAFGAFSGVVPDGPRRLLVYTFPLFLLAAYAVIALGIARTTLGVTRQGITVARTPLPFPGAVRRIPVEEIGTIRAHVAAGGVPSIVLDLASGSPTTLPVPVADRPHAEFLARAMARALGLSTVEAAPPRAASAGGDAESPGDVSSVSGSRSEEAGPVVLICPVCRTAVGHVHSGHGLALCGKCRILIDLGHDPRSGTPGHALVPETLDFQVRDYGLRVTWKPRSRLLPVLPVIVAWTAAWALVSINEQGDSPMSDPSTWGPPAMVVMSLVALYMVLAPVVNRTTFRVERGRMLVTNGPLPYFGDREWRSPSVQEIACETRSRRSASGTRYATRLFVIGRRPGGKEEETDLVDDIPDEEFGLFLMRAAERVIAIPRASHSTQPPSGPPAAAR